MGKIRVKLRSNKTKWQWVLPDPGIFLSLVLDGVIFLQITLVCQNSQLLLKEQIVTVARKGFPQMHHMHQMCPFLDGEVFLTMTQGLVSSHVDYCNEFCVGLTLKSIWKLQMIQNAEAQTIMGMPWLHELQWLPVGFLTSFTVLVITFRALQRIVI